MGEKKKAVTLEFGKSSEAGKRAHLTYVKHPSIAQSSGLETRSTSRPQAVDIC
jgi:hypothetical protein